MPAAERCNIVRVVCSIVSGHGRPDAAYRVRKISRGAEFMGGGIRCILFVISNPMELEQGKWPRKQ